VEKFLAKREFNFLHITDSGQELKSYFPILRNPLTFIVDKNGNIKEITGIIDETKLDMVIKMLNE
jgi:peroxiredoxin